MNKPRLYIILVVNKKWGRFPKLREIWNSKEKKAHRPRPRREFGTVLTLILHTKEGWKSMILPKNSSWWLHHFIMSVMRYKNIVVVSKHIKTGHSRAIKNILWRFAAVVGVNSMGLYQNKKDCEKEIRAERVLSWLLMEDKKCGRVRG